MRWVLVVAVVVVLARSAAASSTACYAGSEKSADATISVVITRELDRDKHEIRTRLWRANAPHREIVTTFRVAGDDRAFTFEARGMSGTGAFDGPLWTAYRDTAKAFGGEMISDVRIDADTLTSETHFAHAGHEVWRITTAAKAFDCRDLATRRAALDDSASDAKRSCFEGTQTILGKASAVVVEQIVEPKRIVFITASPTVDNRAVLAVHGSAITASNGHAWTGKGTLTGKPGAWNSYTYRARIAGADVVVTGTIGGAKIARTDVNDGREATSLEASAFDCAKLDDKLATLTVTP
jgi:hypothetical protein